MMYLLHSVAAAAWMFGVSVIAGWQGSLDHRLSLGGLYLLIGRRCGLWGRCAVGTARARTPLK
jgi:hypothetical protein